MDPLKLMHQTTNPGLLPTRVYRLLSDRFHLVTQRISRVEKATGIRCPVYYIEPNLIISASDIGSGQFGILFARTIPTVPDNHLKIVIQITAPLVMFDLGTVYAILAHEFIHYLQLMSKIIEMEIVSDEISSSLFKQKYSDHTRVILEKVVFRNVPALIRNLLRRFPVGFKDERLEGRVMKEWMHKGLSVTRIPLDSNVTRSPIDKIAFLQIDQELREKISRYEIQELKGGRFRQYA